MPTLPRPNNRPPGELESVSGMPRLGWIVAVSVGDDVGDVAQLLQRADRDDVLGRAGRRNRVRMCRRRRLSPPPPSLPAAKTNSTGCDPVTVRQRVAHRRVVARRRQVIFAVAVVGPAVVGDQRVGQRRRFLQVTVGNLRVSAGVNAATEYNVAAAPCRENPRSSPNPAAGW